jgi:hypothetical protein
MSDVTILGTYELDGIPDVEFVESYGQVYALTDCCQASATGTDDGTACRSCYDLIDSAYGSSWTPAEFEVYLERTGQRK